MSAEILVVKIEKDLVLCRGCEVVNSDYLLVIGGTKETICSSCLNEIVRKIDAYA